jgi:hypothetical protein
MLGCLLTQSGMLSWWGPGALENGSALQFIPLLALVDQTFSPRCLGMGVSHAALDIAMSFCLPTAVLITFLDCRFLLVRVPRTTPTVALTSTAHTGCHCLKTSRSSKLLSTCQLLRRDMPAPLRNLLQSQQAETNRFSCTCRFLIFTIFALPVLRWEISNGRGQHSFTKAHQEVWQTR